MNEINHTRALQPAPLKGSLSHTREPAALGPQGTPRHGTQHAYQGTSVTDTYISGKENKTSKRTNTTRGATSQKQRAFFLFFLLANALGRNRPLPCSRAGGMVWTWPQRSAEVTWETRLGVRLSLGSSFGAQPLAKRLGLEGGPSALLKFPVFQIIKCCSSSPASALPPFSSLATAVLGRLQEAVQRDAQASEVSLGSQRRGRFVGAPSSCAEQEVHQSAGLRSPTHASSPLWRVSELRAPAEPQSLFELIY